MFYRILLYLVGVFITSFGTMFLLIYFSTFNMNTNFFKNLFYVLTRKEILYIPIGLIIIIISLFFDFMWYKFYKYRKKKKETIKKYYKERIKNDK